VLLCAELIQGRFIYCSLGDTHWERERLERGDRGKKKAAEK